jgi:hypothetical protein
MWVKQCHKPCPISAMGVINHSQVGGLWLFAHINFDWCFMSERRSEHGMRAHKGRPTPHWLCDMWALCLDFGSAPNPMVDQFIIIFSWRLLVWYPPWGFSMAHHGASRPWFGMRQKDRSYFGFGHFMWKSSQCCCFVSFYMSLVSLAAFLLGTPLVDTIRALPACAFVWNALCFVQMLQLQNPMLYCMVSHDWQVPHLGHTHIIQQHVWTKLMAGECPHSSWLNMISDG